MTQTNRFKAILSRFLPAFAAVAVLGSVGGYSVHEYLYGGCCHAGSSCCFPGSPCCAGHRVAMK